MEESLRVYSWRGFFSDKITAKSIVSRGHARELGPFVDPKCEELVTWVKAIWVNGRLKRRSHFRRLPQSKLSAISDKSLQLNMEKDEDLKNSSTIHNRCRDALATILKERVRTGSTLDWYIKNPEASDFPFKGNLLKGVNCVETEYTISTPFGRGYRLDVALLHRRDNQKDILLGAVELELHHEFEFLKCLLCKCFGFPLISLDISDVKDSERLEQVLLESLLETTKSSSDGRRRNFFYLHPCLYPVYIQLPDYITNEEKHQYVIFCKESKVEKLHGYIKLLRNRLKLNHQDYNIALSKSGSSMIENEGGIAGHDWESYNEDRYIRVSIPRPSQQVNDNYFFHIILAQILNLHIPSLVGYKYEPRLFSSHEELIWLKRKYNENEELVEYRVCPKHLSDPIDSILSAINKIGKA